MKRIAPRGVDPGRTVPGSAYAARVKFPVHPTNFEASAVARITVEDCLENVDNRFQLVLIATKRARQIAAGSAILVDEENDKPTVLALREVADGKIDASILDEEPEEMLDEEDADESGLMPDR